jgi:hypothetical protein
MLNRLAMAPSQPYHGPIGMADSRYASPQRRKQVQDLLEKNPELKAKKDLENIVAPREQVAVKAAPDQSHGVQLRQAKEDAESMTFREQVANNAVRVQSPGAQLPQAQPPAPEMEVTKTRQVSGFTMDSILVFA